MGLEPRMEPCPQASWDGQRWKVLQMGHQALRGQQLTSMYALPPDRRGVSGRRALAKLFQSEWWKRQLGLDSESPMPHNPCTLSKHAQQNGVYGEPDLSIYMRSNFTFEHGISQVIFSPHAMEHLDGKGDRGGQCLACTAGHAERSPGDPPRPPSFKVDWLGKMTAQNGINLPC